VTCVCPYRFSARQVLWGGSGTTADIIAGIEQATIDGVDVISMSLGAPSVYDTLSDPMQLAVMNAGEAWCMWCVYASVLAAMCLQHASTDFLQLFLLERGYTRSFNLRKFLKGTYSNLI